MRTQTNINTHTDTWIDRHKYSNPKTQAHIQANKPTQVRTQKQTNIDIIKQINRQTQIRRTQI